jgi:tetratricopeptide (TPR) repeat protein
VTQAGRELRAADLERLLALSRQAEWRYPSSLGSPVRSDEDAWVEPLIAEQESFVAAARFLVESGDRKTATELAAGVWRLWMISRDVDGGRAFLAPVLAGGAGDETRARAIALYGDGVFAFWQGALEDLRRRSEEAFSAAQAVDEPEVLALACLGLSRAAALDGDFARSRDLAAQALDHASPLAPAMRQGPLHTHAQAIRMLGEHDRAAVQFEESLALNRRIRDEGMIAVELHNLGHVELHRGNVDTAEGYFHELARLGPGTDAYSVALTHLNEAVIAFARGDRDRASELLARIESVLEESGTELAPDDQFEVDHLRNGLAATVGGG